MGVVNLDTLYCLGGCDFVGQCVRGLWLPRGTFDVLNLYIVRMKFLTVDFNLCSVLFVGVVPMINPSVLCILCELGCCCGFVGVWRYTHLFWLASIHVNLCVVVGGSSPTVNFVVAFCCMYWRVCEKISVIRIIYNLCCDYGSGKPWCVILPGGLWFCWRNVAKWFVWCFKSL